MASGLPSPSPFALGAHSPRVPVSPLEIPAVRHYNWGFGHANNPVSNVATNGESVPASQATTRSEPEENSEFERMRSSFQSRPVPQSNENGLPHNGWANEVTGLRDEDRLEEDIVAERQHNEPDAGIGYDSNDELELGGNDRFASMIHRDPRFDSTYPVHGYFRSYLDDTGLYGRDPHLHNIAHYPTYAPFFGLPQTLIPRGIPTRSFRPIPRPRLRRATFEDLEPADDEIGSLRLEESHLTHMLAMIREQRRLATRQRVAARDTRRQIPERRRYRARAGREQRRNQRPLSQQPQRQVPLNQGRQSQGTQTQAPQRQAQLVNGYQTGYGHSVMNNGN
ncbi:Fc.00g102320.m01.CDS01 [Cosmosporella sp. VM-42]